VVFGVIEMMGIPEAALKKDTLVPPVPEMLGNPRRVLPVAAVFII
jgi:hypothetical protein